MKKLILLLAIAVFAVACEGPQGPRGPGSRVRIQPINVSQTQWELDPESTIEQPFYSVEVAQADLTQLVLDEGSVLVYARDGNLQDILPQIRHRTVDGELYTTTVDYTLRPGFITFFYTNSDFVYGGGEPGNFVFRMVITLNDR